MTSAFGAIFIAALELGVGGSGWLVRGMGGLTAADLRASPELAAAIRGDRGADTRLCEHFVHELYDLRRHSLCKLVFAFLTLPVPFDQGTHAV